MDRAIDSAAAALLEKITTSVSTKLRNGYLVSGN
jgi:hypothetical protein